MASAVAMPEAMALATATPDGDPSVRMVLLKGVDAGGFVFFTSYRSRKAEELLANPRGALVFHWLLPGRPNRQVRATGPVSVVDPVESDVYFRTRPRPSQVAAWASDQSHVLPSRDVLEARVAEVEREYEGQDVPRPPFWGGYRLVPEMVEFWEHRDDRLHDRLRYTRSADGGWVIERLAP